MSGYIWLHYAFDYFLILLGGWRFASRGTHSSPATSRWCMLPAASSFHIIHKQNGFRIIQTTQFQNSQQSRMIHSNWVLRPTGFNLRKNSRYPRHRIAKLFSLFSSAEPTSNFRRGRGLQVSALKVRHDMSCLQLSKLQEQWLGYSTGIPHAWGQYRVWKDTVEYSRVGMVQRIQEVLWVPQCIHSTLFLRTLVTKAVSSTEAVLLSCFHFPPKLHIWHSFSPLSVSLQMLLHRPIQPWIHHEFILDSHFQK